MMPHCRASGMFRAVPAAPQPGRPGRATLPAARMRQHVMVQCNVPAGPAAENETISPSEHGMSICCANNDVSLI